MFDQLQRWFSKKSKRISSTNHGDLLLEISVMLNFLVEEVNDAQEMKSFKKQVDVFCKKSFEKQVTQFPKIYLFLEQYLLEVNKPTQHSKKGLRSFIRVSYPTIVSLESSKVIFESNENKQQIFLGKLFLQGVFKRSQQILGATEGNLFENASNWLNQIPKENSLPIPFNLKLEKGEDLTGFINLFVKISFQLFKTITSRFGEDFAKNFYIQTYNDIAEKYKNLNAFSVVLELFPHQILDSDQVNLLSKHQIQKVLMEKLELLEDTLNELTQKNEELQVAQEQLIQSELALSKQNKKTQDSIHYARRIQQAMLVKEEKVLTYFEDAFIFFKPRDVVSGDFYWCVESGEKLFIAVVDCTGHGVPGSLMSMISNNLLNEIVVRRNITKTNEILNNLQIGIKKALQQEETKNRDGLDIALCMIDKTKGILEFSGAKRPLLYIENNKLVEVKGDRKSIGGYQKKEEKIDFSIHQLSLEQNRTYYLFSDGYADQFGGQKIKTEKFMAKRFREIFMANFSQGMREQKEKLKEAFEQWKGETEQTDDILVLGFRI
jgi:serine phosphatase RsbU (regulator of sigma subunit)